MRKPIQIHRLHIPELPGRWPAVVLTTALCDDGTMWERFDGHWTQLSPIPQDGCKCETCGEIEGAFHKCFRTFFAEYGTMPQGRPAPATTEAKDA
jgi:hypothetical protein